MCIATVKHKDKVRQIVGLVTVQRLLRKKHTDMKALHFGAGNIGRGFIGKVLSQSGVDVMFADVVPVLINNLASRKEFKVRVVGEKAHVDTVKVSGAVFSNTDAVFAEILTADLITTAVGPRVLERIAPTLAKGLQMRKDRGVNSNLNIIACENAIRATTALKAHVLKDLAADTLLWVDKHVGFVDCAVDRIVPPARHEDPLEVTVEDFCEWVVDKSQFVGQELPSNIVGIDFTDNLNAFVERKLLTVNTGHAICAYLGRLYGHQQIREAISDPQIFSVVQAAMRESGAVLVKR